MLARHADVDLPVLRGDTEEGAPHAPFVDEEAGHPARGVDRHREADALRPLDDGGIDPDHAPAGVNQRSSRVAGVERGVGLDDILDQPATAGAQRAPQRRDDPSRDGRLEAEGVADGDDELARFESIRIAELGRGQTAHRRLDHRQIGLRVVADHACGQGPPVGEGDFQTPGPLDDVAIGEDVAVGGDDDARPAAGHGVDALPARPLRRHVLFERDIDHGGPDALGDGDDGGRVGVEKRFGFVVREVRDFAARILDLRSWRGNFRVSKLMKGRSGDSIGHKHIVALEVSLRRSHHG
ncbi:MAG: hypothetical protein K0Q71_1960 [Thermomicrobiales bacterium]|nr:hypothetical protein [Thermomicrobiales bacterium]